MKVQRSIPTGVGTTREGFPPHHARPVHPHRCGDNTNLAALHAGFDGPSPQVWGQQRRPRRGAGLSRSIPTGVGTTRRSRSSRWTGSVHPHRCGDNATERTSAVAQNGPSPQVWGQRAGGRLRRVGQRSIPTGVGTTGSMVFPVAGRPVHPHRCGDNTKPPIWPGPEPGQSPQVWGQPDLRASLWLAWRSMPTGVGTTGSPVPSLRSRSVHPHRCGDNHIVLPPIRELDGPSPQVWGQPQLDLGRPRGRRSIPTGVGTTTGVAVPEASPTVHPHRCGDNQGNVPVNCTTNGPSPQVWGQHLKNPIQRFTRRSIPTGVGTTTETNTSRGGEPVHPHRCGDNKSSQSNRGVLAGPSPQVWGQRAERTARHRAVRSIPTGVGTTAPYRCTRCRRPVHPHRCGDN